MIDVLTVTLNPAVDLSTAVDRIVDTHKLRCEVAQRDPGGGGINVARVLHRLGSECVALFAAGGATGRILSDLLDGENLRTQRIDIEGETRENFSVKETSTRREYRFVLPGPALAPSEWNACLRGVSAHVGSARFLVLSGSLPPGAPPDAYAQLARAATGARPNIRVAVDASGSTLAAALDGGHVDIVKPSLNELRELTALPLNDVDDQIDAARMLIAQRKAMMVALTLADKGAVLATHDETWFMPALKTEVRSAIGAGDSFLAGLIWALDHGAVASEALAYATAAASATMRQTGTRLCDARDVARSYAKGDGAVPTRASARPRHAHGELAPSKQ
ncbi:MULTISPECIES: 1-phosphofructokinase family hexose kinase [Paraburkholderia]|uniref:1-phosphofructokinase family hexose kinase n=1 Tax=Paraburkholderia TaxID=1822464 RepID=UPI00071EEA23|nr:MULTISPECIES: 1-phosphofructokinase family hexose kinase [Paraburkholderia]ALP67131.1 phosphofructokinase [Paraburkholderia caribensis]AUT56838.1 phosphofructokinase [Paraburkholderia caribensis]